MSRVKGKAAMCQNKRFFDTEFEAEVYAAKKYGDPTLQAYKCVFCNMYHVGHPPRKYKMVKYYGRMVKKPVKRGK